MPATSEATKRYRIIDECLTNIYNPYPSKEDLIYACKRELGKTYSGETIQKDIEAMKKSEKLNYLAPIIYCHTNKGYYYDDPDFTIRTSDLNETELESIELAIGILNQFKGIKINDSFNHALGKLLSSVDKKKSINNNNLSSAIQPEEVPYSQGLENFSIFTAAISKQKPISFIHYSFTKKQFNSVIIHPYLIKESGNRWYLIGLPDNKKEIRYFGIDRIYDPILLNKNFEPNTNPDLLNIFKNKIGLYTLKNNSNNTEQTEEIICVANSKISNYIKTLPIHPSQIISDFKPYGDIEFKLNIVPTVEFVNVILSYGSNIKILSPKWLCKFIEKEIMKSLANYKLK